MLTWHGTSCMCELLWRPLLCIFIFLSLPCLVCAASRMSHSDKADSAMLHQCRDMGRRDRAGKGNAGTQPPGLSVGEDACTCRGREEVE
ncbi:hypothetical protein BKA64DRAFT_676644 [Cadophora sp. MPI-SDFR-AT-0126]|nr:hypothetical protein BKA64DRAFT_676644 [Leotiomycetes sp. MPI-SDFR-AT-0126]